jgi:hypothetical protein
MRTQPLDQTQLIGRQERAERLRASDRRLRRPRTRPVRSETSGFLLNSHDAVVRKNRSPTKSVSGAAQSM